MADETLVERVIYALDRREAAETGRRVRHLARELGEEPDEVLAALRTLRAQGRATLSNATGVYGGRWWLAAPPPSGYVRTRINPTGGERRARSQ